MVYLLKKEILFTKSLTDLYINILTVFVEPYTVTTGSHILFVKVGLRIEKKSFWFRSFWGYSTSFMQKESR